MAEDHDSPHAAVVDEATEAFDRHVQAKDAPAVAPDDSLLLPQELSPSDVDLVCETDEPTVAHPLWDLQSHRQQFGDGEWDNLR